YPLCASGIGSVQVGETVLQPERIERVDGKYPDTALCTTQLANQPLTAAPRRASKRRVDDLHYLGFAHRQRRCHANSVLENGIQGGVQRIVGNSVDQTHFESQWSVNLLRRKEHLQCASFANQPWQALRAAPSCDETKRSTTMPEHGMRSRY